MMLADDFPSSPHIKFAILDLEQNYMDLLSEDDKYDLAIAKQAGKDYTQLQFLRVQYLLDGCQKIRKLEQRLKAHYGH